MSDQTPTKTIRVRILVATDGDGKWASYGESERTADQAKDDIFFDHLNEPFCFHWVEADVPLPEPEQTIQGEVKP